MERLFSAARRTSSLASHIGASQAKQRRHKSQLALSRPEYWLCFFADDVVISAAEGNALDLALRKDLGKYQPFIEDLELVDYRFRVFQGGTDAVTRVLIEFRDGAGEHWSTVGVSANIIDASFQALTDAITFKLMKAV